MKRALVVNCSKPYNLGTIKLRDWLTQEGWGVTYFSGDPGMLASAFDLICVSSIFSWDAPLARKIALSVKDSVEVWAGGPGLFALQKWWRAETSLPLTVGLDDRFEKQRGDYLMTFASRGCPVGCWFCIVPRIEGGAFTLDWDFQPAPILSDNNLSALPDDFQDHVLRRYQETGIVLKDAQSGFEPKTFTEETYERWRPIMRGPWRLAFDEMAEIDDVETTMHILRKVNPRKVRVYVLIGNEPLEACYERAIKVLEWGGEPFCQPFIPLNSLDKAPSLRHGWTGQMLKDFARYFNRFLWKYTPLNEYAPRKNEPPPFAGLLA